MLFTIYEVLQRYARKQSGLDEKGGLRPTVILADNWNRKVEVTAQGAIVVVRVADSSLCKLPRLEGTFQFDLEARVTNANPIQVGEIFKILRIRDFSRENFVA